MTKSLHKVQQDLIRRRTLPGGFARERLEESITDQISSFCDTYCTASANTAGPSPAHVTEAMALAVFAVPYLCPSRHKGSLSPWVPGRFYKTRDSAPPTFSTHLISELFELPIAQLDALQGTVDNAMGSLLQRMRTISAIYHHFDLPKGSPRPLFEQLFPIIPKLTDKEEFNRSASAIYAIVAQTGDVRPSELYLPWVSKYTEGAYPPLHSFRIELVDQALTTTISRALGFSTEEVNKLLQSIAVIIPHGNKMKMFRHDLWRSSGLSTLTGLADGYTAHRKTLDKPRSMDLGVRDWLLDSDGAYTTQNAERMFVTLLSKRLHVGIEAMHAEILGRYCALAPDLSRGPSEQDLDLLDISLHAQALASPLLEWVQSPSTVAQVAAICKRPLGETEEILTKVEANWRRHLGAAWTNPQASSSIGRGHEAVLRHMATSQYAVRTLISRPPIRGVDHRPYAMAFCGFLFKRMTSETLLQQGTPSNTTWPGLQSNSYEDVCTWFWSLWEQLLEST